VATPRPVDTAPNCRIPDCGGRSVSLGEVSDLCAPIATGAFRCGVVEIGQSLPTGSLVGVQLGTRSRLKRLKGVFDSGAAPFPPCN
jgi:hypothetical protein